MLAKLKDKSGAALIAIFMVITVLLIYCSVFISVAVNQNSAADRFKRRTQAFSLAEAGLDKAVNWLRAQPAPPVGDRTNPWGGVQNLGAGTYSVVLTDLGLVGGAGGVRRYKVTSTGLYNDVNRVLTNYIQVDNYARYIWFTDRETYSGTTVWFWTPDHLNGPTHTNAHFNIYGNPVFEGEVSCGDDYIRFYNNGNNVNLAQLTNPPYDNPDFQNGVDFGAEKSVMPKQALNLRAAASSGGLFLSGNTTVVLTSAGTMTVTNSKKGWCNKVMALPANGAFFVNGGNLTISGTLNGRLTVGASSDIMIPTSIVYAEDPRTIPGSDDVLGIIAESDVVVDDSAPNNVEIDGCIMGLNTSFMMENWWLGSPKGTLTVYGGIIQDERGPVGTFNAATGQKKTGYTKDYAYDSRLLSNPPPFMPTTGDYVTLSWEED